jgi:hypothetical protein
MDMKHKLNKLSHGYGNVTFNENHNFGGNVDNHIKSLGHGKIGFIMDQKKDNLVAIHHQDGGKHHLSIFHKDNLVNQSTHHNFDDASGHAHSALTTKKGIKAHVKENIQIDEISADLVGRYSDKANKEYNDPKTPERKKATRRAGLIMGYNKAKGRANVPATYEEMSFTDRLLQRAWLPESRGPVSGASETFTDNNMGEMTDAQTKKFEKSSKDVEKKGEKEGSKSDMALDKKQMNKEDKDDGVPFDRPYSTKPAETKDKSGAVHTPMSRVKHLAKTAMKRLTKETMMGKAGTTSEETEND